MSREKQIGKAAMIMAEIALRNYPATPTGFDVKTAKERFYEIMVPYSTELYAAGLFSQEWISVKDRLPDVYETVLVWGKDTGGVRRNLYSPNSSIWKDGTVSHWMPLPESPKTEGGDLDV